VKKKGLEVCSDCPEYPCKRFDSEKDGYDSFVTHKKVFSNLDYIKNNGIDSFIEQQSTRIGIMTNLLQNYDDGRSKSFYCLSCTLLPIDKLQEVNLLSKNLPLNTDVKEKNKQIRGYLLPIAESLNIKLILTKK
jgi:hypothetical protein